MQTDIIIFLANIYVEYDRQQRYDPPEELKALINAKNDSEPTIRNFYTNKKKTKTDSTLLPAEPV